MNRQRTLFIVEIALLTSLAYVFDFVANVLQLKIWAQGGSISIAMVPVFLIAIRWGLKGGILAGLLLGTLQVITGQAYIAHPVQGALDYFIAFGVLGFAGIFAKSIHKSLQNKNTKMLFAQITLATLLGSALRFLSHFTAGVVFFGEYAPEGTPVTLYSFLYNASYMLPAFVLSAVLLFMLLKSVPKYFTAVNYAEEKQAS
ncbi:energy-coupled thiamine transporter ThiT [Bacillus sp. HMF5848]|uniref:energy-coupled thiamine transporter ThiT n=1 Tax=Bacillus sp. HMF5848 TaxID=2495421 RepID=UPI000F78A450|nr:energy-coupled thiamine transporter ThiT [Bacillus sp. HMF5848]RSK28179.1 energy-coupled thiamine transporter ThiT [Bacillus sp. HMF5848]